jgi:pyridinium-3,5-biscarboxylic acid mononucleotide sulfurtransferase
MPGDLPDFSEARIPDAVLMGKYRALRNRLRDLGPVLIGFSGGVDSTLLAGVARDVLGKDKVLACLALGPSLPERERLDALRLAVLLDLEIKSYAGTEFANPAYLANGADRCFHCKTDLFEHLGRFADDLAGSGGPPGTAGSGRPSLLYGGNSDDALDYRPGRRAADLHGALAPMAEAGLTKAEVRALSRAFGLPTADKPAMPCLSSRIPYGSRVEPAKLAAVEAGEALLSEMGFRECRLRHEGETARIEVPLDQAALFADAARTRRLVEALKAHGFRRALLDLEGFRSGNLNEALPADLLRRHSG